MPIDPRLVKWEDEPKGKIDPRMVKWEDVAPSNQVEPPSESASDYAKGIGAGALRGAADIGNTLLNLSTFIPRKLAPQLDQLNNEREAALNDWTKASQEAPGFTAGRIAANVAGTAGIGGAVAPLFGKFAPAIASGGFNLGNLATDSALANAALRAGGGAIQGGIQTAMVDPSSAGTGAAIGAATPAAVKTVGLIGQAVPSSIKHFLGASTGVGADAISTAYQAGKSGATDFLDNMRGNIGFDDVVAKAKEGLSAMRQARQEAYRSGMADVSKDKSVLDFAPIDSAMQKISSMGNFKGVQINKNASGVVDDLMQKVDEWKALNPAEYHTPEGFDALKQAIGDIRDTTQYGTSARKAADSVYNAVKGQITMQAPTYSKVMKDYSEASNTLAEIEGALSLGNKAKADTSIRKLQSLMRNNAQTSYGNRLNLANTLQNEGGVDILPSIAGQAMNSWTPRGMVGAIEKAGALGAGGAAFFNPAILAPMALTAPLTSPRIVGNMSYGLGRAMGGAESVANMPIKALGLNTQGLLDPATLARILPVAISASQIPQR